MQRLASHCCSSFASVSSSAGSIAPSSAYPRVISLALVVGLEKRTGTYIIDGYWWWSQPRSADFALAIEVWTPGSGVTLDYALDPFGSHAFAGGEAEALLGSAFKVST